LTNIQAWALKPQEVRRWSDDLWMFPFCTSSSWVPYDVLDSGPASTAWPNEKAADDEGDQEELDFWPWIAIGGGGLAALLLGMFAFRRRQN
jgi:hypothetical protein